MSHGGETEYYTNIAAKNKNQKTKRKLRWVKIDTFLETQCCKLSDVILRSPLLYDRSGLHKYVIYDTSRSLSQEPFSVQQTKGTNTTRVLTRWDGRCRDDREPYGYIRSSTSRYTRTNATPNTSTHKSSIRFWPLNLYATCKQLGGDHYYSIDHQQIGHWIPLSVSDTPPR